MSKSSKVFTIGLLSAVVIAIMSWQPIPEHQSYTKESSLLEKHIDPVFVNYPKTISVLPHKLALIKDRPEIKFNNNLATEEKIVKTPELEKTEKEKMTVTTESQQATGKPPKHSKPNTKYPTMGDTRIVNGIKQVYFLGFGWIDDDNKPNEKIAAKDMFENGNKVGNMEGTAFMDSDGDIDKIVGTMGD